MSGRGLRIRCGRTWWWCGGEGLDGLTYGLNVAKGELVCEVDVTSVKQLHQSGKNLQHNIWLRQLGLEPRPRAWEARILPLNYCRA